MDIEDVAWERFAARRAAHQQGQLAVGVGVLGQVIINDQRVAALIAEVLRDRGAGIGREVLHAGRVGGLGDHDDRAVERADVVERVADRQRAREPLADHHIDADDLGVALRGHDVERERGLADVAIPDDQLSLAAADRDRGVDRGHAGLERHDHGGALHQGRRRPKHLHRLAALGPRSIVARVAERADHPAKERVARHDDRQPTGRAHALARADRLAALEQDDAGVVRGQIVGHAAHAGVELDQLFVADPVQTDDSSDAITDLDHRAAWLQRVEQIEGAELLQAKLDGHASASAAVEAIELVESGLGLRLALVTARAAMRARATAVASTWPLGVVVRAPAPNEGTSRA